MKALITGINGFTGKHLVAVLKKAKMKVSGIDIKKGRYGYEADLNNKSRLGEILKKEKPDYIFHLASPLHRSDQLVDEALKKNLAIDLFGTVNLIEAAAELKKKPKLLITGTNAQYQPKSKGKFKETDRLEPVTSYGLSKLTQELVSRQLAKSYGLKLIYTRTFHLVGPGQRPGWIATDLAQKTALIEKRGFKAEIEVGDLRIKRDFTDVRDAARAYLILIKKGKHGEVYNVCSGKTYAIAELVKIFQKLAKKKIKIKQKPQWRKNDPSIITGDNQKLRQLGWKTKIDLKTSLKDTLDYWRSEVKA